jgi:hypothetical protein
MTNQPVRERTDMGMDMGTDMGTDGRRDMPGSPGM